MRFVSEYRDVRRCRRIASMIRGEAVAPRYKIMEVCGTHTAAIRKFGIREMLPPIITLISGPGCPVCVTSEGYLKNALGLARQKNILLATYHDMLRVPAGGTSLETERSRGALVQGVQSAWEAVELARVRRDKEVVFLAVGFETTAPGTAIAVEMARKDRIRNFSAYVSHKTIPPALAALSKDRDLGIQGFLLPGHVSAIIGLRGYRAVWKDIRLSRTQPCVGDGAGRAGFRPTGGTPKNQGPRALAREAPPAVISGFEPLDILVSVHRLVRAINRKKPILENEYSRVVHPSGNLQAQKVLRRVFERGDGIWRGLGLIRESALVLRKPYRDFDAAVRFGLKKEGLSAEKRKGCRCADVVKGKIDPPACPLFRKVCKPEDPKGPCMVSREGTCRSFYEYS